MHIALALNLLLVGTLSGLHIKWGQSKEKLFVTFMVKNLQVDSVDVSVREGEISFVGKDVASKSFQIALPLSEDVLPQTAKWELLPHRDAMWGKQTLVTVDKFYQHRWGELIETPKKFRKMIDKDWGRDDPELEADEDSSLLDGKLGKHIVHVTSKNLHRTVLGSKKGLLLHFHIPFCKDCKTQENVFMEAASRVLLGSKDEELSQIAWGVADPFEMRSIHRQLGGPKCSYGGCHFYWIKSVSEDAKSLIEFEAVNSDYDSLKFIDNFKMQVVPAVTLLDVEATTPQDVKALGAVPELDFDHKVVFIGVFQAAQEEILKNFRLAASKYRQIASFYAVANLGPRGEARVQVWWPGREEMGGEKLSTTISGLDLVERNGDTLKKWVKAHAIAPLSVYKWEDRALFEDAAIPTLKVFKDDDEALSPSFQSLLAGVVKEFMGKINVAIFPKISFSYEMSDYGLTSPVTVLPSLAIASSMEYNHEKYGFSFVKDGGMNRSEMMEKGEEEVKALVDALWASEGGKAAVRDFITSVLAGTRRPARKSAPIPANAEGKVVREVVFDSFEEEVMETAQEKMVVVQFYHKYRSENQIHSEALERAAQALVDPEGGNCDGVVVVAYELSSNGMPFQVEDKKLGEGATDFVIFHKSKVSKMMRPKKKKGKPAEVASPSRLLNWLFKNHKAEGDLGKALEKYKALEEEDKQKKEQEKLEENKVEEDDYGDTDVINVNDFMKQMDLTGEL